MLDRLSQLIKNKDLSASQFADEIGVQRSSVSHVLSGRNKPSLDFITKVILRFPDINPEWLLTGRGVMLSESASDDFPVTDSIPLKTNATEASVKDSEDLPEYLSHDRIDRSLKEKAGKRKSSTGSGKIEKIVIFCTDGTFSEYTPGK